MAYTTYNADGTVKSVQTKAQKSASDAADIASGKDTAVGSGVGQKLNTGVPDLTGAAVVEAGAVPKAPVAPQTPATAPSTNTTPNTPTVAPVAPTGTNPYSTGEQSYENAQKNLAGGGLTGDTLAMAQQTLKQKYGQGLATLQGGGAATDNAGVGRAAVAGAIQSTPDTTVTDAFLSADPGVTSLMDSVKKLLNPIEQTTSLMDDYKKLQRDSGLDEINQELIDADTIINGTEDDIRNEISTAGGFATDSAVQAMSLARNKGLLKRYNQLVQMKTDATNQLNTLSSLNAQDKQMAQQKLDRQLDTTFKLATFQQQATNNIKEAFNAMVSKVGYTGAYQAYAHDPKQLAMIEKSMGLGAGGLAGAAAYEKANPSLDDQLKKAQISNVYSEINARNNPAPKPQTQPQIVAQGYADRAKAADQIIRQLGANFTGAASYIGNSSLVPNALKSAERQQFDQAKRDFITAVLRPESGASISPDEFKNADLQYFPQPGDKSENIAQKNRDRQLKIGSLYQQSNTSASTDDIVEYGGKQYTVDADGNMTPV